MRAIEALAQAWHNVVHEGFLDVGRVRIASYRFVLEQERNAYELGRDSVRPTYGGPRPRPPRATVSHLHVV